MFLLIVNPKWLKNHTHPAVVDLTNHTTGAGSSESQLLRTALALFLTANCRLSLLKLFGEIITEKMIFGSPPQRTKSTTAIYVVSRR
jgi:hypothetical protein